MILSISIIVLTQTLFPLMLSSIFPCQKEEFDPFEPVISLSFAISLLTERRRQMRDVYNVC